MPFPSKYAGSKCVNCNVEIEIGEMIHYDRATKSASHEACGIPGARRGGTPPKGGKGMDAWDRTVQHGRADVPLCDKCGHVITKDKPAIHVACAADHVPF
jgi:hypothetical protein